MKAIVQDGYGSPDVLKLQEIDQPAVGEGDVLVRVRAAAVNPLDRHIVRGRPYLARFLFGWPRPKVPVRGVDVAGVVEAVGPGVERFRVGDEVFGWCRGAFAEYAAAAADHFVPKPASLTFEQAAAVPVAAFTALQALRDVGRVRPGQAVLINGAAGGVGTFAVQIAKVLGADVTGVCSARNADLVRSLGADRVVDYAREDFARLGRRYDLVLDNVGNRSLADCRRALSPAGTLVLNNSAAGRPSVLLGRMLAAPILSRLGRQKFRPFLARANHGDLAVLKDLIASEKLRSVVDRTFPLEETAAAIAYLEAGHARGKVIVVP